MKSQRFMHVYAKLTKNSAYQKHTKNAIVMIGKEAVRILTRMITNWTAYGQVWPEYGTNPLTAFNWRQVSASRKDFSLLRWSNAVALYSFKEGNASKTNGNWSTLMLSSFGNQESFQNICTRDLWRKNVNNSLHMYFEAIRKEHQQRQYSLK